jgi:gliding motility-associatede transport system auxiliary component
MKTIVDFLAPFAFIVVVGAWWLQRAGKLPGDYRYYLYGALFLVLLHVALRFEDIVKGIGRRQMKYGANTLVMVLSGLGLLTAINYVVARNSKSWDLTKNKRYSLSDQTKKILGSLKEDVKVVYFQKSERMAEGQDRLKGFEKESSHIKAEYVDPVQKPARAKEHEVTQVPTLVLERGSKREKITNDSEQDITNALIKVTRDTKKTVCFAAGEGEADMDDFSDRGYSAAKGALGKSQYETKKVVLLQEGKIPADCTVIVVPGPQKDFLPAEISLLRDHVKQGGKLFMMVEPEMKGASYPNLTALLKEWNVETAKDVVLDVSLQSQLAGTGPLMPLAAQYPYHEITKDFRLATAFQTSRSMKAGSASVPGVSAQNLVETSAQSWAESDLSLKEPVQFDEGKDQKGPVSLAAVVTVEEPEPSPAPSPAPSPSVSPAEDKPKKPQGRVVAVGDADFATNAFLGFPGNQDLFVNAVAWLAEDADLISIRPREADDQRLFLTAEQQWLAHVLSLLAIPGLFVVAGVWTWWRRR